MQVRNMKIHDMHKVVVEHSLHWNLQSITKESKYFYSIKKISKANMDIPTRWITLVAVGLTVFWQGSSPKTVHYFFILLALIQSIFMLADPGQAQLSNYRFAANANQEFEAWLNNTMKNYTQWLIDNNHDPSSPIEETVPLESISGIQTYLRCDIRYL